jgi:hypothetical protein
MRQNKPMNEGCEQELRSDKSSWILFAACAPLVYLLSLGPVGAITKNMPKTYAMVRRLYSPVRWLHDHTLLKKPLEAYVNLWGFH